MKKIAFSLQVCGLVILLPICVFLEMNHPAGTPPIYKNHPGVIAPPGKTGPQFTASACLPVEGSLTGVIKTLNY